MGDIWHWPGGYNKVTFPTICDAHREIFRVFDHLYDQEANKQNQEDLECLLRCSEILFNKGKNLSSWRNTCLGTEILPDWKEEVQRQKRDKISTAGIIFEEKYRMEKIHVAIFKYLEDPNCPLSIDKKTIEFLFHRLEHAYISAWKMRYSRSELPLVFEPRIRNKLKNGRKYYEHLAHIWTPPMTLYPTKGNLSDQNTKYFTMQKSTYGHYLPAHKKMERELGKYIEKIFPDFESINLHESY